MNNIEKNNTISSSKQESILKAIQNLEQLEAETATIITRPKINLPLILLKKTARLILFAAVIVLFVFLSGYINPVLNWALCTIAILLLAFLFLKGIIIEWVLIYQRFAPEHLRRSCRFEPTCSEYMILAVNKYGPIKGLIKGIGRLLRCRYPNGGTDYP